MGFLALLKRKPLEPPKSYHEEIILTPEEEALKLRLSQYPLAEEILFDLYTWRRQFYDRPVDLFLYTCANGRLGTSKKIEDAFRYLAQEGLLELLDTRLSLETFRVEERVERIGRSLEGTKFEHVYSDRFFPGVSPLLGYRKVSPR